MFSCFCFDYLHIISEIAVCGATSSIIAEHKLWDTSYSMRQHKLNTSLEFWKIGHIEVLRKRRKILIKMNTVLTWCSIDESTQLSDSLIWKPKIKILQVKQPTGRILKEIFLPYNIVLHLKSPEFKVESEMVHGKWKQYWQWIWATLAVVYKALYSSITVFPVLVRMAYFHYKGSTHHLKLVFFPFPQRNMLLKHFSNLEITTCSTLLVTVSPRAQLGSLLSGLHRGDDRWLCYRQRSMFPWKLQPWR